MYFPFNFLKLFFYYLYFKKNENFLSKKTDFKCPKFNPKADADAARSHAHAGDEYLFLNWDEHQPLQGHCRLGLFIRRHLRLFTSVLTHFHQFICPTDWPSFYHAENFTQVGRKTWNIRLLLRGFVMILIEFVRPLLAIFKIHMPDIPAQIGQKFSPKTLVAYFSGKNIQWSRSVARTKITMNTEQTKEKKNRKKFNQWYF